MSFEANKVQLSTYNHAQIGVKRANQCSISMPPDYLIAFLQGNEVKKEKKLSTYEENQSIVDSQPWNNKYK